MLYGTYVIPNCPAGMTEAASILGELLEARWWVPKQDSQTFSQNLRILNSEDLVFSTH